MSPVTPSSHLFSSVRWDSPIFSEDPKSEIRNWKSEVRAQKSEVRGQRSVVGGLLSVVHTSLQRSAGSCLSKSGLLHGIALTNAILSAAYAGPCNGRNRRSTFANCI